MLFIKLNRCLNIPNKFFYFEKKLALSQIYDFVGFHYLPIIFMTWHWEITVENPLQLSDFVRACIFCTQLNLIRLISENFVVMFSNTWTWFSFLHLYFYFSLKEIDLVILALSNKQCCYLSIIFIVNTISTLYEACMDTPDFLAWFLKMEEEK